MDVRKVYGLCYFHQTFSLPDTILFHITKNPSTQKAYEKLIQTCKYFFAKNPILVVQGLKFDEKTGWQILMNDTCYKNDMYQLLPFNKISSKIWITRRLEISSSIQSSEAVSALLQNLFQCDAWYLSLKNQMTTFDNLLHFTKNVSTCYLMQNTIMCDTFDVTLETFIDRHPKLQSIIWRSVYPINVNELFKVVSVTNITFIVLFGLTDEFDTETFYEYLKRTRITESKLFYNGQTSVAYRNNLDKFVDKIINTHVDRFFPICIKFPGMLKVKYETMKKLSKEYYEKQAAIYRDAFSVNSSTTITTVPSAKTTVASSNLEPVKKVVNRCQMCNKRVGLIGFDCRCGKIFCGEHRYDFVHNCTFDYKTAELEELRKDLMGNGQ